MSVRHDFHVAGVGRKPKRIAAEEDGHRFISDLFAGGEQGDAGQFSCLVDVRTLLQVHLVTVVSLNVHSLKVDVRALVLGVHVSLIHEVSLKFAGMRHDDLIMSQAELVDCVAKLRIS